MKFTEDWFGTEAQTAIGGLVEQVAEVDGLIVEIGAWEGRSTIAMANAAHPRVIHTVDTWMGSPSDQSRVLARSRNVHADWISNVSEGTHGNVIEHRMDWREYVATIDEPVALVFIDAEHTYAEVLETINAFAPLVAERGVVCGDDIAAPGVSAAVMDALGDHDVIGPLWVWRKP